MAHSVHDNDSLFREAKRQLAMVEMLSRSVSTKAERAILCRELDQLVDTLRKIRARNGPT